MVSSALARGENRQKGAKIIEKTQRNGAASTGACGFEAGNASGQKQVKAPPGKREGVIFLKWRKERP